ncbi:MAG TPA: hypothetical protein VGR76_18070, partial [Candidatus Angelobacter sp.]|nr:hypothetical protein [Candidatus Angelobacter sp.]
EKGSQICYAHAGQLATAVRRERERRAVLEEAVAQMRRRGRPDCKMADLFMDFNGIQITIGVMTQALIDGRIDCKTAGRLVVQLQTVSKLLRVYHRGSQRTRRALTTKYTKKHKELPQICADERRLKTKNPPLINTDDTDLRKPSRTENQNLTAEALRRGERPRTERYCAADERERTRIAFIAGVLAVASRRGWAHAPPELLMAA